jgi:hypothetical protein
MSQNDSAQHAAPVAQERPSVVTHPSSKPTSKAKKKAEKSTAKAAPAAKPERYLPTERITFRRQLDLLRGYAAATNDGSKSVTNKEVAAFVDMTESTASIANAFFIQNGFLTKGSSGLLPAPDVVAFKRAHQWDPTTSAHKLSGLVARSWFGQALLPRLSMSPLDEDRAIQVLAEAANANPKYRTNLRILLEYLEASGLVAREGTQVRGLRSAPEMPIAPTEEEGSVPPTSPESIPPEPGSPVGIRTVFNTSPTAGVIEFQVNVRVDMREIGSWRPDRIAAFFSGIAQVVAAKGALEKNVSGDN